jgi:hypothetical protein
MKTTATKRTVNWKHLPDAITEAQVKLELAWSADERHCKRQSNARPPLMGFQNADREADTISAWCFRNSKQFSELIYKRFEVSKNT